VSFISNFFKIKKSEKKMKAKTRKQYIQLKKLEAKANALNLKCFEQTASQKEKKHFRQLQLQISRLRDTLFYVLQDIKERRRMGQIYVQFVKETGHKLTHNGEFTPEWMKWNNKRLERIKELETRLQALFIQAGCPINW
jgi:hypothetical protein